MSFKCTHEKHGVVYDSYRLTRTICEGNDADIGNILVEICDFCKAIIITITEDYPVKDIEINRK